MAELLTNQAYDYLYEKIITCEYLPGQEINEKQLLESTSFGRTPIREALRSLQSEGLVQIYPRKGMQITPFTEKNIDDIYQTRKLIEPTVCKSYIAMYSKSTLLDYSRQFKEMEKRSSYEEFLVDARFHSYLVGITGNDILINMFRPLMVQQTRLAVFAAMSDTSNRKDNPGEHEAIIDALLRENEQDAQDAIILHINRSLIKSLKALKQHT